MTKTAFPAGVFSLSVPSKIVQLYKRRTIVRNTTAYGAPGQNGQFLWPVSAPSVPLLKGILAKCFFLSIDRGGGGGGTCSRWCCALPDASRLHTHALVGDRMRISMQIPIEIENWTHSVARLSIREISPVSDRSCDRGCDRSSCRGPQEKLAEEVLT